MNCKHEAGPGLAGVIVAAPAVTCIFCEREEMHRILAEAREVIADALDGERSPVWGKAAMATLDHIDDALKAGAP